MLYFVRHGESTSNLKKIYAGQRYDAKLTPKGEQQAREAGQKILDKGLDLHQLVSSPMTRAFRSAEIIAETIGFEGEIKKDARLAEFDMGDLSGKPWQDITSEQYTSANGSEDPEEFMIRVSSALDEYTKVQENVLISSHASVWRVIRASLEGIDPKHFYDMQSPPNGEIIPLEWF